MLLTRLECSNSDSLGDISVTEANMLHFLGVIEQRTNDLLTAYHNLVVKDKELLSDTTLNEKSMKNVGSSLLMSCDTPDSSMPQLNILGAGPEIPMGGEQIFINPPRLADYSSDDNSIDDGGGGPSHPQKRDELKNKALSRISQHRRSKSGAKGIIDEATRKRNVV